MVMPVFPFHVRPAEGHETHDSSTPPRAIGSPATPLSVRRYQKDREPVGGGCHAFCAAPLLPSASGDDVADTAPGATFEDETVIEGVY
jgi:hypothetical protein